MRVLSWWYRYTGPKLKNCTVLGEGVKCFPGAPASECRTMHQDGGAQRQITLNFDEELLGADLGRYTQGGGSRFSSKLFKKIRIIHVC